MTARHLPVSECSDYCPLRALCTRGCALARPALTDLVPFQAASISATYASCTSKNTVLGCSIWPIAASSGPYTCCGQRLMTLLLVRCETRAGICPAVSVHCTPWFESQCMNL